MLLQKKFNILLIVILFFSACTKEEKFTVVKDQYSNGKTKLEETFSIVNGDTIPLSQTEYHENGAIKVTGQLDSLGQRNGVWESFYADSSKWSQGTFIHGLAEGERKVWYPNGQIRIQGQYKNNKEVGIWTFRNQQGKVIKVKDFDAK